MLNLKYDRRTEDEHEEGAPIWMITFADMMTLLMAFFVMLLSFANTDVIKFKKMMGSVHETFGSAQKAPGRQSAENFDAMLKEAEQKAFGGGGQVVPSVVPGQGGDSVIGVEQAGLVIRAMFQSYGEEGVEVTPVQGGVMVKVPGSVMFDSGSAEIRQNAGPIVEMVRKLMARYRMDLHINGHTDSAPIQTAKFPSNWELSGARAAAALRFMAEKGIDPKRMVAVGYADSRPIADNGTFEGRQKNRRIEFVFKNQEVEPESGERARPATP